jgi:hypothetical protein
MLRTILEGSRLPSWPLGREVALLEALTRLYAARDAARYRFALALPPLCPRSMIRAHVIRHRLVPVDRPPRPWALRMRLIGPSAGRRLGW